MNMAKHPLQKIVLVLLALCCIGALWMAVSEMLPEHTQSGLEVQERVTVSSAPIDKDGNAFSCLLSGSIKNPTDSTVNVKALRVTVSDGRKEQELTLPGFSMPARTNAPVSLAWQDSIEWNQIQAVFAEYEEGGERIPNVVQQGIVVGLFSVVWLAVAVAFGYAAFAVGRALRYQAQEDAMKEASEKRAER